MEGFRPLMTNAITITCDLWTLRSSTSRSQSVNTLNIELNTESLECSTQESQVSILGRRSSHVVMFFNFFEGNGVLPSWRFVCCFIVPSLLIAIGIEWSSKKRGE